MNQRREEQMPAYSSAERGEQPFFERLDSDSATQLQSALASVEELKRQVATLERINVDLESRLERQAKERIEVEQECAEIDRRWREKYNKLEKSMDQQRGQIHKHQQQNDRLREHLRRTERELHGILQRKYQFRRNHPQGQQQQQGTSGPSSAQPPQGGLRRGWGFSRDNKKSAAADVDVAPLAQKSSSSNLRSDLLDEEVESSDGRLSDLEEEAVNTDMGYAAKSSHAHEVRQSRAFASLSDFFGL